MSETILMRQGRQLTPIAREAWEHDVSSIPQHIEVGLGFMSEAHHLVRYFVVRELLRVGESLSPEFIARQLHLPIVRVQVILDELEKHLTFLFRNARGAVAWAYPVTVDCTPHHVTLSTGEQGYAA